jgi:hypothetical protein
MESSGSRKARLAALRSGRPELQPGRTRHTSRTRRALAKEQKRFASPGVPVKVCVKSVRY